jgi:hypothetical protein
VYVSSSRNLIARIDLGGKINILLDAKTAEIDLLSLSFVSGWPESGVLQGEQRDQRLAPGAFLT